MNLNADHSRYTVLTVLIMVLAFAGTVAAEPVSTDRFIGIAISEAIKGAQIPLPEKGSDTLYLRSETRHTADYLVEDALYALFKDRVPAVRTAAGLAVDRPGQVAAIVTAIPITVAGTTAVNGSTAVDDVAAVPAAVVKSVGDAADGSGYILDYRVTEAAAGLGTPFRNKAFGTKSNVRTASVECWLRLLKLPSHTIVWTGTARHTFEETIDAADAAVTEHKKFVYQRAPVKRPLWRAATEVILAGGTIGALMFLFFTQSFN